MAGWIKFEKNTPRKPEIGAISAALGITPFETLYRCLLVWSWADDSSTDGFLKGIDVRFIDTIAGRQGFGSAMESAGWLVPRHDGVEIPDFEKWMGQSEKKRERQRRHREKTKGGEGATVAPSVAHSVAPTGAPLKTATSPSISSSQSPSEGKGRGVGKPSGPADSVEAIAQRWCFDYVGTQSAQRNPYKIADAFREWTEKRGVTLAKLRAAIEDKHRDRTEPEWQLKERLFGKQAVAGGSVGPNSRVRASEEKLALYDARTIRLGETANGHGAENGVPANGAAERGRNRPGHPPGLAAAGGG